MPITASIRDSTTHGGIEIIDTDNSMRITNSEIYINSNIATDRGPHLRERTSIDTLNGPYVALAETAVERLKKKWPRVQLSAEDILECVEIKLKQTNHLLDLLAKLECNQAELTVLESEYSNLRYVQETLSSKPTPWNPWNFMKYLYEARELKRDAKRLYERSERVSEATREANRSRYSWKRSKKKELLKDSRPPQQAGDSERMSSPASGITCDETNLARDIVHNEALDSDDEDDHSDDEAPTSHESSAGIPDESDMPTPRVNAFGPGISS